MNYRYKLDDRPGKRKINCPNPACPDHKRSGAKTFTRYYDTQTGNFISDEVGRCDHEVKCRYHLTPSEYFDRFPMLKPAFKGTAAPQPSSFSPQPSFFSPQPSSFPSISFDIFRKTLKNYLNNNLYLHLRLRLTQDVADAIVRRYYLGTSKYLAGTPVFWYIDSQYNITTGKIMYYPDPVKGKRYRESDRYRGKPVVNFVHAVLKMPDFKRKPCFFGEHLLTAEPHKSIIVVESEKTALIASVFHPDHVVLATGGMNGLMNLNWSLTRGREVVLIPDTSIADVATNKWKEQAKAINSIFGLSVKISETLDTLATDAQKAEGWDIADFLLRCEHDIQH